MLISSSYRLGWFKDALTVKPWFIDDSFIQIGRAWRNNLFLIQASAAETAKRRRFPGGFGRQLLLPA
jgi:hypothetical protein